VPQVADLLRTGSRLPLRLLAGPTRGRLLSVVTTVESLEELAAAPRGSLAVVTGRAVARAPAYRMDIAMRQAAERDLTAVVLIGCEELPRTASQLAVRAGLAVLTAPAGRDVADVVLHVDRVIRGGAADALARAQAALHVIRQDEPAGSVDTLLTRVSEALGVQVAYTENVAATEDTDGEPVVVNGRPLGGVTGPPDDAALLVLPALAGAVSRVKATALAREMAPGQTRAELLTELVVTDRAQASRLTERARTLGLPVDGVHVAACLIADQPMSGDGAAIAERRRVFDTAAVLVLRTMASHDGDWNVTRVADDLVVLCTGKDDRHQSRRPVEVLINALRAEHPSVRLHGGIGTPQRGLDGLRQSVLEARAAATSAAERDSLIAEFDATGVRRVLAEVLASPLSRKVIDDLLAPLDELGDRRGGEALRTLGVYLDTRSSPRAAGARLHLHPNAVAYRIRRITERLGVDLDDADTRFALHLACRVRLQHLGD
jgi:sugar diacid utilization regulator